MITLYQFPISHYCEKVRWALDYKGLDWTCKNLLLGPHIPQARKLSGKTTVPILQHNKKIVRDSSKIISYLDENFPEKSLTPVQDDLKQEALEWERYLDKEVGIHLRRYVYSILLNYPRIVKPFFSHNGPWYGSLLYLFFFPALRKRMISILDINKQTAQLSKEHLAQAIDKIYKHLDGREFLVGNQFTRADLTAASLLAPLVKPGKYGLDWPEKLPDELEVFIENRNNKLQWVRGLYDHYR